MKPTLHAFDGQPVEAPGPDCHTYECGCEDDDEELILCSLHRHFRDTPRGLPPTVSVIIVHALFVVAGRMAVGDSPAEAVANVKTRWGL
ncbi:MAG TPA: hypothetical protein DEB56_10040 [Thiobacillus sp.]|nr:hypothetical protein [Thiobacillus sp.]